MAFVVVEVIVGGMFAGELMTVDEVATHYPWDGKVDCVCTLSGAENGCVYKGVFTLSVKNGGETVRRTVTNDLAAVDGICTNTFDCAALFGDGLYPNGGITVELVKEVPSKEVGASFGAMGYMREGDVAAENLQEARK